MSLETSIEIRVRYAECDPQNVVHHASYPVWLEMARTELLREQGAVYRDMEASGVFFVVALLSVRYRRPAHYDDLLTVKVIAEPCAGVKVDHRYEIRRGNELLATAETTLACVNAQGKIMSVPEGLLP